MPSRLYKRAKQILETEGALALLRRMADYFKWHIFGYSVYYIYRSKIGEVNELNFKPKLQYFAFKIVSSNEEADELAAQGLEFRSNYTRDSERLQKGAVAFCIFVNGELAYISWVAMSEDAYKSFAGLPLQINFSNGEVYTASVSTNPNYRRMGLATYARIQLLCYLREIGKSVELSVVPKNNTPMHKVMARFSKPYAEAHYLRILRWKFWKEKPFKTNFLANRTSSRF